MSDVDCKLKPRPLSFLSFMHIGYVFAVMAALGSVCSAGARAADGDPEAGRKKTITCNGCHAQAGMQNVPSLGGQSASYFVMAMRAYQDGKRAHATMRDVAKAYSDRELKNFAAYYAQLATLDAAEEGGSEVPAIAAACESCHGPQGRKPLTPENPVLAGQKAGFLKTALREYREGTRKHVIMQPQAANLADEEIDSLATYFAGVKGLVVK